ncbi:hypothetical protein SEUCBS139899_001280 [Sporothrix eucalyptigena]|uniref:Uncharacterized protein n=1 Tax=Sporothrix eucalyptigena TaxID=1812306 RepID=A0ABP0C8H8_9PEZI
MSSRDRPRQHGATGDCSNHSRNGGRKSGGRHSDHAFVSPEADSPRPPRSSSRKTPSDRLTSTPQGGSSSGRTSRASGVMMSLFGRRNSRRERSDSDPPSPRRVPVVKDVFLQPSVPSYIRNSTGYENIPAPPYEQGPTGTATTGATTTGVPYALSNIPAQIYLLQPQQHMPTAPGSGSKENNPAFIGQTPVSTPSTAPQPQFVSSFYTYPQQQPVYQWQQKGGSAPLMPVPMHGLFPYGSTVSRGFPAQSSPNNENSERLRPHSPSSDASSRAGGRRERRSSPVRRRRQHSRQQSYDSSATETKYRSRRLTTPSRSYRRSSPHHNSHRIIQLEPKKEASSDQKNEPRITEKAKSRKASHYDVDSEVDSKILTRPKPSSSAATAELSRTLSQMSTTTAVSRGSLPRKERHRDLDTRDGGEPAPPSVKRSKSKESTKTSPKESSRSSSSGTIKKPRGYQPPTVESVVDTDDAYSTCCQTYIEEEDDDVNDDKFLETVKTETLKASSPAFSPHGHDDTTPEEGGERDDPVSPTQAHMHFEPESSLSKEEVQKEEEPYCSSPYADMLSSLPTTFQPVDPQPSASRSLRRSISDYVNFEKYMKHREMAKENLMPKFSAVRNCCDHNETWFRDDVYHGGPVRRHLSSQMSRDMLASPLQPIPNRGRTQGSCSPQFPKCSGHEPRTFSVHTVSPSIASEHHYDRECHDYKPASPAFTDDYRRSNYNDGYSGYDKAWEHRTSPRYPRWSNDSMYSTHRGYASPDYDEDETQMPRSFSAGHAAPSGYDVNVDPISQLGQGIPPYNFDLFSEVSSKYAPEYGSHNERAAPRGDFYSDEDVKGLFDGTGSFFDSSYYGEDSTVPPPRRHRFEDDPIIPDYNFDLFSDVTNGWAPQNGDNDDRVTEVGSDYSGHNTGSPRPGPETSLVLRKKSTKGTPTTASRARRPSTFEVEEYNGTDDETNSATNSSVGTGTKTLLSSTQRMIDCEVISNPEDVDGRFRVSRRSESIKCRASVRTFQTAH